MRAKLAIFIVALMVLPLLAYVSGAVYVNTITIKRIEDDQAAIQSLEQGFTQARLFGIRDPALAINLSQRGFKYAAPASGLVNILVNPAPCSDGSFNPFTIPQVRLALQYLINREEIVSTIYEGYAIPVITPWTPRDPDYPYLIGTILKWQVNITSKGPDFGKQLIENALTAAGATKQNGNWTYNGQPIVIKFVIRTEDKRKDIGDTLASTLKSLGFQVDPIYTDFSGAYQTVYKSDPAACKWHLYTEGWGITGMTKYDYSNIVWFYSSLWGGLPGWGHKGWYQYNNSQIDAIAAKLDSGNYTSWDEFWNLMNTALDLGIKDSVRVFVVATYDFYIYSADLSGVLPSPKASPWHTFTFMNLQYTKDAVNMSNRYVYKTGWSWNPVAGWQDFYSRPVVEAITWRGVTSRLTDGMTGWSPANSVTWTIQRGLKPSDVPADAIYYDHAHHKFVTVGEAGLPDNAKNATEIIAVTYKYNLLGQIKFHDGTTETMADFLAPIYIAFEYGFNDATNNTTDARYEANIYSDYYTLLNTFVAAKLDPKNKTVTVYTTYTNLDDGYVAQTADIWTNFPLELYAGMDLLWQYGSEQGTNGTIYYVFDIYSEDNNHTAIHLLSKVQDDQIVSLLQDYKNNPPDWVQQLINMGLLTLDEWQQRVDNLVNFYQQHHHLVIGNGPFYLDSYDAVNDIAVLKRVQDFPVNPQTVAQELQPKTVDLTVTTKGVAANTTGSVVANLTVSVNGQPATENDVDLYLVLLNTQTYETVFLQAKYLGNGQFQAVLPQNLPAGDYKLIVFAYPVGYSNPSVKEQIVTLVPAAQTQTGGAATTTGGQTTTTSPAQTGTTTSGGAAGAGTTAAGGAGATGTTTQAKSNTGKIVAAVIVVLIIIGAAYYFMAKK